MSEVESEKAGPQQEAEEVTGGELLFCGGTSWDIIGRGKVSADSNLVSPTRLRPLIGVDIRLIASGCSSCHCVALDVGGRCYTWGRNEKGQLGHGDTIQRDRPTVVWGLSKYKVVKAGTGRSHSVVASEDGQSFSFGWNKHGQLGSGSVKNDIEASPVRCLVSSVKHTTCGADFTVWLTSAEGASILTAGLPQYGQLGHGTNNEYNSKDGSVRLVYGPQPHPRAIVTLSRVTIIKVACGTNHTVAVDSDGFVYTWGFGGYGRLGHREQKDEWAPRRVEAFQNRNVLPPDAVISAGSVNSSCTAGGGQLYMWGKIKITGDVWMYPKPLLDLSGWNIRCMDSGNMHYFVGADSSCISWGHAQHGELGYGPNGQKSSAVPKKVDVLDGMHVISVACGLGHSMVVVDRKDVAERLELMNVYDGKASDQAIEPDSNIAVDKPTSKKGIKVPVNSKRKKSKQSSKSEDEEDGDQEIDGSEEEANTIKPRARKAYGVGRGKAPKSSATVGKATGRGRGHPPPAGERSKTSQPKTGKRGRPRKMN